MVLSPCVTYSTLTGLHMISHTTCKFNKYLYFKSFTAKLTFSNFMYHTINVHIK